MLRNQIPPFHPGRDRSVTDPTSPTISRQVKFSQSTKIKFILYHKTGTPVINISRMETMAPSYKSEETIQKDGDPQMYFFPLQCKRCRLHGIFLPWDISLSILAFPNLQSSNTSSRLVPTTDRIMICISKYGS